MRDRKYLFSEYDWFSIEQNQVQKMEKEINATEGNYLLNTAVDDLARYFEDKFTIEVPALLREEIVVSQHETQVDVRNDPYRFIDDRSRPAYVQGTTVEVEIPFTGEAHVFKIQPVTFGLNLPYAEIRANVLILQIEGINLQAEVVRSEIDKMISKIDSYLDSLRGSADGLNRQLFGLARTAIESRRQKLLADSNLVGSLGFKIKGRPDSKKTFVVPEVRRKLSPTPPPASSAPFKPEPTLGNDDYEHILNVLENMAHVMERSPSAFKSMGEESLRSHFLVQLNGHYEGRATGETFNYEGKTDILVRSNGRNVFIAECKFWSGPKVLIETINQLLGYSSWRDTKVAVIVFNRNRDFSKVLASIPETVRSHPNYKRELPSGGETKFRYIFAHRDDVNREMFLAVLAFDIPSGDPETL